MLRISLVLIVLSQTGPTEQARAEQTCRTPAARAASAGATMEERRDAIVYAQACPDTGPALLAAALQTPLHDKVMRQTLTSAAQHLVDARIANAALELVLNRTSPVESRSAALEILVTQMSPGDIVILGPMYNEQTMMGRGNLTEVPRVNVSSTSSSRPKTVGRDTITIELRRRVHESITALSKRTDDTYIALAAREVLTLIDPNRRANVSGPR